MADDDALLSELAEALRSARAVPTRFLDVGKAAFAWHGVDAELAALVRDSPAALSGTRADGDDLRALTFVAGAVTLEVEATAGTLQGQVVPPQPGEIELRLRDGTTETVPVDEVGWFVFATCPVGLFGLYLRLADGARLRTAWTALEPDRPAP